MIAPYNIPRVREVINFVIVVGGIFVLGMSLLFSEALKLEINHFFASSEPSYTTQVLDYVANTQSLPTSAIPEVPETKIILEEITGMTETNFYDYDLATHLETKLPTYTLAFNTMVPDNRLIVPSLDIHTPIVNVQYASEKKLATADFDQELTEWVVRYPFTANPGDIWNSLIFWHSSVDGWEKNNPYGFVFYKLPKIGLGEDIHIIWEGKLHTYTVEEKSVKNPEDVSDELLAYNNEAYLTLMACYPLFSDARRMLVRARYKKAWSSVFAADIVPKPTF